MATASVNPLWAGVVIQLDNGTTWAVEIDRRIVAELSTELEGRDVTPFGNYSPRFDSGDMNVDVHIRGRGHFARHWTPPTPPARAEIEQERKAIEA